MTIAIVIGTHGWAAEQLLKTAEMLLGEQENVGWIDFVPGENAETLIEKYNAQTSQHLRHPSRQRNRPHRLSRWGRMITW
ncbi:MAG: mannose transporter subunit [Enterobacter kobei]|nr:mannose transporter subunit [Enterobacter kobei]